MAKRFQTISEFCAESAWDLKPARIRAWCRNGISGSGRPPFRKIGRRYFIDAPKLEAWLDEISGTAGAQAENREAAELIEEIIRREDGEAGKHVRNSGL